MIDVREAVTAIMGTAVADITPLSGGCIGQVYRLRLATGDTVVAKVDESSTPRLSIEAYMLRYLAQHSQLPVPAVYHDADQLLILQFLSGHSHFSAGAQAHAAELLAALHSVTAPAFGLAQDTLIGGLIQPNPWTDSWLTFFREHRLWYMAREALRAGRLPAEFLPRLTRLGDRLSDWLMEPERPSLIHGDVWTTNVLARGNVITGFVDPAIYYADPEIELAFTTLFGTFDRAFFARYQELRPIAPGFTEIRRDLYNLYPLLVHVRLFGGSYVSSVDAILRRFGF